MSWNVPAVLGGDPTAFANLLVEARFEAVCLKAGDGNRIQIVSKYSPWPNWGENVRMELVNALRAAGIKVYFWHFLYGYDPAGEKEIARAQCDRFAPDGYIWNVEGSFDNRPNAVANARYISSELKRHHPDISQGLCWWALPVSPTTGTEWHPVKVAKAFFEVVDTGMPMMYWQGKGAAAAVSYFNKSLKLWRRMTDLPITPIGRSYNGDGGYADPPGITAFANQTYELRTEERLVGNSWYSLDKAAKYGSWLLALADTPKFGTEPVDPPPVDPPPDEDPKECPNNDLIIAHGVALGNLNTRLLALEELVNPEPTDPPVPPPPVDPPPPPEEWPYTATIDADNSKHNYVVAWAITAWNGDVPIIETNMWAETNDPNYKFFDKEVADVFPVKVVSDGGQKWFELAKIPSGPRLFIKKEDAMKNW
jgi:hypothetical protein